MASIDRLLSDARAGSGLSRSELARRTDTTRAALLEYEKGKRVPRADTFLRVLDANGVEVSFHPRPTAPTTTRTLAEFANGLGARNDQNWRLLVSDFVANEFVPATRATRSAQLDPAPPLIAAADGTDPRWMHFLAALAEHVALHAGIEPPSWALEAHQPVEAFWWPVHGELASMRAAAMAFSPASFRRRRILIDGRELPTVTP